MGKADLLDGILLGVVQFVQIAIYMESTRYFKSIGKEETDTRLYITSLKADAKLINNAVRFH
jgi:hypothetical protein